MIVRPARIEDAPAYAWAKAFDFDASAGRLYATVGEIDPAFGEAVKAGRYKKVSMAFFPPQGYEAYAAGLDITTLTPEQYGVVRSYLLRVSGFTRAARWSLGARLANPLATAMGHAPPPNIAPETFLACVAAWMDRASSRITRSFAGPFTSDSMIAMVMQMACTALKPRITTARLMVLMDVPPGL